MGYVARPCMMHDVGVRGIDLLAVSKRHHYEILVITFVIGIHRGIALTIADRAGTFDQADALHLVDVVSKGRAKSAYLFARFEVKAGKHMKHVHPIDRQV